MTTKTVDVEQIAWKDGGRAIDRAHVKDLAASIAEVGLLSPIAVVALPDGTYEGRAGRHRYEAVKSLGEKAIDVQVLDLDEVGQRLARIDENLRRKDLDPIQRATEFRDYLELRKAADPKVTQAAVAKELRVSAPELSNTLLLLEQPDAVRKHLALGSLKPGHVEHAIAPLAKALVEKAGATELEARKAVEKFAFDVARGKGRGYGPSTGVALDVRTAKEEADVVLKEVASMKRSEGILVDMGRLKVKVRTCPVRYCGWDPKHPDRTDMDRFTGKVYEEGGRAVVAHDAYGGESHRWYGDTGEICYTPAERKAIEAEQAKKVKARKATAKGKREKVERDYAVFYSRATLAQWAHALLDASDKAIAEVDYDEGMLGVQANGMKVRASLIGVELASFTGAGFHTRVAIKGPVPERYDTHGIRRGFSASPNRTDNVAEAGDVKALRKLRKALLEFQRTAVKVQQADGDLWPKTVGAFALGEKVRIGAKSDIKSYVGKQGVILAFDEEHGYGRGSQDDASGWAVLDIAASTKHHPVRALEKIEAREKGKGAPKGRRRKKA